MTGGRTATQGTRDRFLAFAFASGDVLLEVDPAGLVRYARGASGKVLGVDPSSLEGRPFAGLLPEDQKGLADEFLARLRSVGRVRELFLDLEVDRLPRRRFAIAGLMLPDRQGVANLVLARRPPATGLESRREMSVAEFSEAARDSLRRAAEVGQDYSLSLVDLSVLGLGQAGESETLRQCEAAVLDTLRAWTAPESPLARLEDGKIGLVHEAEISDAQIRQRVSAAVRGITDCEEAAIGMACVSGGTAGLSEEDVTKALAYTLRKFVDEGAGALDGSSLAASYQAMVADTMAKVKDCRSVLSSADMALFFQPIIDVRGWAVHHYETLARFREGEAFVPPGKFIAFAEEIGIITEFDDQVVRRGIEILRENKGIPPVARIAVNLSARSVANPAFIAMLMKRLSANLDISARLLVEITEYTEIKDLAAVNAVLQEIRKLGCQVCIDDFGAGATSFQYLSALKVDFVKIDGQFVRDVLSSDTRPFLKAIAGLCNDLKVRTIGEMVEDERTVWLLRDLGVLYTQGYFFSRPVPDATSFKLWKQDRGK